MFDIFKKKRPPVQPPSPPQPPSKSRPERFPPVPDWRPEFEPAIERIIDRAHYYCDRKRDFAVFSHGTIVILPLGLSDEEAKQHAVTALMKVFHAHPDMNPRGMDDGNILVGYNHDVASIVLSEFVEQHWATIDREHQRALATHEVLITPLGHNVFDNFGKKALFGRCFMFMDAQSPTVAHIERASPVA